MGYIKELLLLQQPTGELQLFLSQMYILQELRQEVELRKLSNRLKVTYSLKGFFLCDNHTTVLSAPILPQDQKERKSPPDSCHPLVNYHCAPKDKCVQTSWTKWIIIKVGLVILPTKPIKFLTLTVKLSSDPWRPMCTDFLHRTLRTVLLSPHIQAPVTLLFSFPLQSFIDQQVSIALNTLDYD